MGLECENESPTGWDRKQLYSVTLFQMNNLFSVMDPLYFEAQLHCSGDYNVITMDLFSFVKCSFLYFPYR